MLKLCIWLWLFSCMIYSLLHYCILVKIKSLNLWICLEYKLRVYMKSFKSLKSIHTSCFISLHGLFTYGLIGQLRLDWRPRLLIWPLKCARVAFNPGFLLSSNYFIQSSSASRKGRTCDDNAISFQNLPGSISF